MFIGLIDKSPPVAKGERDRSPFYRIGSQSQRKKERIPSISAQNPYICHNSTL